ncbi:type II toxin-antitoxin system VapC family toxin [Flavobacterium sp.]|jgi:predicted nucleic acid-binding protein|uniref:type II toxin-antitoxin system VapC family toxin n=1 Tax=Flavobacterium sp. TaxID=239 RepID=UPI0037C0AC1F
MRLFLDTNVILDLILNRQPFFDDIAKIVTLSEKGKLKLVTSSVSFVNCNYILGRSIKKEKVTENLKIARLIFDIIDVSQTDIDKSLNSDFEDFEDGVQYYSALRNNCNYIITRDNKDFKHSEIPVLAPSEFLKILP